MSRLTLKGIISRNLFPAGSEGYKKLLNEIVRINKILQVTVESFSLCLIFHFIHLSCCFGGEGKKMKEQEEVVYDLTLLKL